MTTADGRSLDRDADVMESLDDALLLFACVAGAAMCMAAAVTTLYARWGYARFRRPRYDPSCTPRCAVIVPCKGIHQGLDENLRCFLALDGAERVVFAVESEDDPAFGVIGAVIAGHARAALVVAGFATACSQKNHNMLAALESAGDAEVYVFADADIRPSAGWLAALTLPLSDATVTATTGFRWLVSRTSRLGPLAHVYANVLLYVVFAFASVVGDVGLWGGAMALRRADFDALEVRALWSRAPVCDMSLSRRIIDRRRRTVLVPDCVTDSEELLGSPWQTVRWFERQCMYLKACFPLTWGLLLVPVALLLALQAWLPVSLALTALYGHRVFGAAPALAALGGDVLTAMWFPALGAMPGLWRHALCLPLFRSVTLLGYARTALTDTIVWSGIRYTLTRSGQVASVVRER